MVLIFFNERYDTRSTVAYVNNARFNFVTSYCLDLFE